MWNLRDRLEIAFIILLCVVMLPSMVVVIIYQQGKVHKILLKDLYGIEMTTWQAGCVSITLNGETE